MQHESELDLKEAVGPYTAFCVFRVDNLSYVIDANKQNMVLQNDWTLSPWCILLFSDRLHLVNKQNNLLTL